MSGGGAAGSKGSKRGRNWRIKPSKEERKKARRRRAEKPLSDFFKTADPDSNSDWLSARGNKPLTQRQQNDRKRQSTKLKLQQKKRAREQAVANSAAAAADGLYGEYAPLDPKRSAAEKIYLENSAKRQQLRKLRKAQREAREAQRAAAAAGDGDAAGGEASQFQCPVLRF